MSIPSGFAKLEQLQRHLTWTRSQGLCCCSCRHRAWEAEDPSCLWERGCLAVVPVSPWFSEEPSAVGRQEPGGCCDSELWSGRQDRSQARGSVNHRWAPVGQKWEDLVGSGGHKCHAALTGGGQAQAGHPGALWGPRALYGPSKLPDLTRQWVQGTAAGGVKVASVLPV